MNKVKIHLACGTVYLLDGWTNVDIEQPNYSLAIDRPDLVLDNQTTLDNYYKRPVSTDQFKTGELHYKQCVCDEFMDIRDLKVDDNSVDEMLGVQVFEHFSSIEARKLLNHWRSKLKKGGSLRLHVPDIKGIISTFNQDRDMDWAIRQLYGSQKNEYGVHKYGYTFKTLKRMMEEQGFKNIERVENINDYDAFGIRGYK